MHLDSERLEALTSGLSRLVEDYLATIEERPVFPALSAAAVSSSLPQELPVYPEPVEALLDDCRTLLDASRHNGHPRFFGYVASPASPAGVYGDLLASALNANVTSWRSAPSATDVERTVVRWLGELTGFPASDGVLMSGGSIANLLAVHIASRAALGRGAGAAGLAGIGQRLLMYVSTETHHSMIKAADILGLGTDNVRQVRADDGGAMNAAALRRTLSADAAAGGQPFMIVGTAGTTATGAIDPLAELASIADEYGCWFHVDAAYGGAAAMVEELKPMFAGLASADSITLDPHKWLYAPLDCAALLLRDAMAAPDVLAESSNAAYIETSGYQDAEAFVFWDRSIELSRRFRGLKLWLLLRTHGTSAIAQSIAEDCRLARRLAEAVDADPQLEMLAPVTLSICCFRVVPSVMRDDEAGLDALNAAIITAVQRKGTAYISGASVHGKTALRACIINFRTTERDLELLLDAVHRAADEALSQREGGRSGLSV
jgi:aromatic-L-amino-acid/L-tryptophan decarboxylase